jgi:hypothetical protein
VVVIEARKEPSAEPFKRVATSCMTTICLKTTLTPDRRNVYRDTSTPRSDLKEQTGDRRPAAA